MIWYSTLRQLCFGRPHATTIMSTHHSSSTDKKSRTRCTQAPANRIAIVLWAWSILAHIRRRFLRYLRHELSIFDIFTDRSKAAIDSTYLLIWPMTESAHCRAARVQSTEVPREQNPCRSGGDTCDNRNPSTIIQHIQQHRSVTAQPQHSHSIATAQSRHNHRPATAILPARSQHNHRSNNTAGIKTYPSQGRY